MAIRIIEVQKDGRRVTGYKVSDGNDIRLVSKEQIVKAIEAGQIDNAKVQWYQGNAIVRIQDDSVTTSNRRQKSTSTKQANSTTRRERKTSGKQNIDNVEFVFDSKIISITGNDIFKLLLKEFEFKDDVTGHISEMYMTCTRTWDMSKKLYVDKDKVIIAMIQDYIAHTLMREAEVRARMIYNKYKFNGSDKEPYPTYIDDNGDEIMVVDQFNETS